MSNKKVKDKYRELPIGGSWNRPIVDDTEFRPPIGGPCESNFKDLLDDLERRAGVPQHLSATPFVLPIQSADPDGPPIKTRIAKVESAVPPIQGPIGMDSLSWLDLLKK